MSPAFPHLKQVSHDTAVDPVWSNPDFVDVWITEVFYSTFYTPETFMYYNYAKTMFLYCFSTLPWNINSKDRRKKIAVWTASPEKLIPAHLPKVLYHLNVAKDKNVAAVTEWRHHKMMYFNKNITFHLIKSQFNTAMLLFSAQQTRDRQRLLGYCMIPQIVKLCADFSNKCSEFYHCLPMWFCCFWSALHDFAVTLNVCHFPVLNNNTKVKIVL